MHGSSPYIVGSVHTRASGEEPSHRTDVRSKCGPESRRTLQVVTGFNVGSSVGKHADSFLCSCAMQCRAALFAHYSYISSMAETQMHEKLYHPSTALVLASRLKRNSMAGKRRLWVARMSGVFPEIAQTSTFTLIFTRRVTWSMSPRFVASRLGRLASTALITSSAAHLGILPLFTLLHSSCTYVVLAHPSTR